MCLILPPLGLLEMYSSQYAQSYFGIVLYLLLAAALCGLLASLAYVFSLSSVQDSEKRSEYECGFEPFDSATRLPFDVHFYLVGILFLIFDVEIALLFPWVLGFQSAGWFGFYLMLGFIALLGVGFLYEWKRGALIWPARQQKHQYVAATNTNSSPVIIVATLEFLASGSVCAAETFALPVLTKKGLVEKNPYSNTKELILLQKQHRALSRLRLVQKFNRLRMLITKRDTKRVNKQIKIAFRSKIVLRNVKALLQNIVTRTCVSTRTFYARNFTDAPRIDKIVSKFFRKTSAVARAYTAFAAAVQSKYKKVDKRERRSRLQRRLRRRSALRMAQRYKLLKQLRTPQARRLAARLKLKIVKRANIMKFMSIRRAKSTKQKRSISLKRVRRSARKIGIARLRRVTKARRLALLRAEQQRRKRYQKKSVRTIVIATTTVGLNPAIDSFVVEPYAVQFLHGFGLELLFTGVLAGWLVYLASQLSGEKSKKALALESVDFFSSALSTLISCYVLQLLFGASQFLFHGYFLVSVFTISLKILTAYSGRFILANSQLYIKQHPRHLLEYPFVLTLAIFFMLLLVSSSHLISGFLSLVGFSLNLYVLVLFDAKYAVAREAGVKYFYLSTLSSGLMLYGIFIIFLVLNTGQFHEIGQILSADTDLFYAAQNLLRTAIVFLFTGLFFKLSAFPGHLWAAEVYEGASDPITAFFMLPTKVAVLAFVTHLLVSAFSAVAMLWQPLLALSAILSLLWGCIAAVSETKTKRFLAYASINQIGFLLLGLATGSYEGYRATLFFLFIYAIMNLGFLTVFLNLRRIDRASLTYLTDFRGFSVCARNAWSLSIILLSMAGIPPLAGFFGKYYLLLHAQEQALYALVFTGLFTSLISTYYYLRLIKIMWFENRDAATPFVVLDETKSTQLQLFEWLLWAFILFASPVLSAFDTLTTALFTSEELPLLSIAAVTLFTKRPTNPLFARLVGVIVHLVLGVLGTISTAAALVLVYHSIVYIMASWSVIFFYALPALTLVFAVGVTVLNQPTHGLLCLIAVFFVTVLLYLQVGAEFLAFLFLIVYVGAIAILFLFVIMLLHLKETELDPEYGASALGVFLPPAVILIIFGYDTIGYNLSEFFTTYDPSNNALTLAGTNGISWSVTSRFEDIRVFSDLLYTYHCFLFFLVALLLLTAMLGAIILATQSTDKEQSSIK